MVVDEAVGFCYSLLRFVGENVRYKPRGDIYPCAFRSLFILFLEDIH